MGSNIFRYSILLLIISLIIPSIIFIGCHKSSPGVTQVEEGESGSLSLGIDKQNAPPNVVEVRVLLTRENYENITGQLNILTDSTADIFLENIYAGEWHLLVEALNENGTVVYKGETDVTILEGITIQVNLVLNPTGEGSGSIYIFVTWGESGWIDYPGNPLLKKTNSYWDTYGPNQPRLLYDEGLFKMWFGNLVEGGGSYVGYAYSYDGKSWIRPVNYPVLTPGSYDEWDYGRAGVGPVIKKDNLYVMYYNGWGDQYNLWQVGIAVSQDGIKWEKYPDPVFSGEIDGDDARINANYILKKENIYYMYYTYGDRMGSNYKIGLATSADGIQWEKYSANPILAATEPWEVGSIGNASIITKNNQYEMIYSTSGAYLTAFGMASSKDGITWEKNSGNPFFTSEDPSINWDIDEIRYPFAVKVNSVYFLYYTGFKRAFSENSDEYKIGLVTKND